MTNEAYTVIRNSFSMQIPDEQLKKSTAKNYSEEVKSEIIELSKQKKYLPFVAKHLLNLGIDTEFWQEQYNFYLERNHRIFDFIKKLFDDFYDEHIESVFAYENFGGLLLLDDDFALFSSGDVDLCASREDFQKITEIMQKKGFVLKQEKDERHNLFRVGYRGKIGDMDYRINLMFKPLVRYRMPIEVSSELISGKNMQFYRDTHIRIPTRDVLLYLNILRISVHGYVRSPDIRLYTDVYNCSKGQANWEQIVSWAKKDGNLTRVIAVSYVAHTLFGTSIPQWLLDMKNETSLKADLLIKIICDVDAKRLKCSPNRIERQLTEFYSDGNSFFSGMFHCIFPSRKWLKEYYGRDGKGTLYGYWRYLRFVFRGLI